MQTKNHKNVIKHGRSEYISLSRHLGLRCSHAKAHDHTAQPRTVKKKKMTRNLRLVFYTTKSIASGNSELQDGRCALYACAGCSQAAKKGRAWRSGYSEGVQPHRPRETTEGSTCRGQLPRFLTWSAGSLPNPSDMREGASKRKTGDKCEKI